MADTCDLCKGSGTIRTPRPGGGHEDSTCPDCKGSGRK